MSKVSDIDDAFWPALVSGSKNLGVAPASLALVMFSESGIHPEAVNSSGGASGINQFMPFHFDPGGMMQNVSLDDYRSMSASEQLPYVLRFWRGLYAAHPGASRGGARDLYWLNFYPATYVADADDDHVIVSDPGVVSQNTLPVHDGAITAGSMKEALDHAASENSTRWNAIVQAINEAGGGGVLANVARANVTTLLFGFAAAGLGVAALSILRPRLVTHTLSAAAHAARKLAA